MVGIKKGFTVTKVTKMVDEWKSLLKLMINLKKAANTALLASFLNELNKLTSINDKFSDKKSPHGPFNGSHLDQSKVADEISDEMADEISKEIADEISKEIADEISKLIWK